MISPAQLLKPLSYSSNLVECNSKQSMVHRLPYGPLIPAPTTTTPTSMVLNKVQASVVAGSCAGMFATVFMYPLEVIRVKMQTCHKVSPWQAMINTMEFGGIRALYTGLPLPLAAQMCYKATIFTTNEILQSYIVQARSENYQLAPRAVETRMDLQLSMMDHFLCGAISGIVNATIFVTPVEYVRNQLIGQHTQRANITSKTTVAAAASTTVNETYFRSAFCVIRNAWYNGGLQSLWRGSLWTISRDAIGCGCFFSVMHWTQKVLSTPDQAKPSWGITVVSGGIAGLSYWIVALPLDTAKTWIQTTNEPVSVANIINKIYQKQGATGVVQRLFRGWQVTFGRSIPSAAISYTSYTFLNQYLLELQH